MSYKYLCKIYKYSFNVKLRDHKFCICYHICQFNNNRIAFENKKKIFECIPSMNYQKHLFYKKDFRL